MGRPAARRPAGECAAADDLPARERAADQNRSLVVAEILRFVRPSGDEGA